MTKTIDVVFDGEVLRPEGPVDLKPHARYRVTVEEAVSERSGGESAWDVLERLAGTLDSPPGWAQEPFEADRRAFHRHRARLLRRYEGQFVAFCRGRMVAHGPDDEELARQMFERYGEVPFYIARVERTPTVYELPSPEVVRR